MAYEQIDQRMHNLEEAILTILSYIQSQKDYQNVLEHMSLNPKLKVNVEESKKRLYNGLGVYGRSKLQKLQKFKEAVDNVNNQVIYPQQPKRNEPVKQNKEVLEL